MSNVAVNHHRVYVVVCQTPPAEGGRVLLKTYDSTNASISPLIVVNKSFSGVGQNSDVILDDSGIVTVVWEQFVESRIQIGLARFGLNGHEIGLPVLLKDDQSLADQLPRVAMGKDGRFIVVWHALQRGIRGQLFTTAGKKSGNLFQISQKNSKNPQYPSVRIDKRNRIGVVWQEGSDDDFHIVMRIYDEKFRSSRIIQVDDAKGRSYFSNPELLFLGNGNLVVAWKDYRSGEANIFQQIFNTAYKSVGNNMRVNDDSGAQWQRLPRLAGSEGNEYALVWEDYRNSSNNQIGDIYVQRFSGNGIRMGINFKVEIMDEPTAQRFPAVAMNHTGELVITWSDTRNNSSEIYMAQISPQGQQQGSEVRVFP